MNETPKDLLLERYREANSAMNESPNARVRASVLAHAQAVADANVRAGNPTPFAQKRAANDGRWKYALAASVFTASVTGFIAFQLTNDPTEDRSAFPAPAPTVATAPASPATAPTTEKEASVATAMNAKPRESKVVDASPTLKQAPVAAAAAPPPPPAAPPAPPAPAPRAQSAPAPNAFPAPQRATESESKFSLADGERRSDADASRERLAKIAEPQKPESRARIVIESTPSVGAASADLARATTPANEPAIASGEPTRAAQNKVARIDPQFDNATDASPMRKLEVRPSAPSVAAAPVPPAAPAASPAPAAASDTRAASPEAQQQRIGELTPAMREGMRIVRANGALRDAVTAKNAAAVARALAEGADANSTDGAGTSLL
ncbi:MAG: hypothetical protein ACRDAM_17940, partial [Casimicrobium sp.]